MSEEDKKKPKTIGDYRIGKVLGTGSYGYVRLGVNIITGEQFAIKTLKDAHNKKGIQREIAILRLLDHPNIVKLHDVVEDVKTGTFYLVLELAGGGELFDYVSLHETPHQPQ
jgi:serine/threonine protein kinase